MRPEGEYGARWLDTALDRPTLSPDHLQSAVKPAHSKGDFIERASDTKKAPRVRGRFENLNLLTALSHSA